jgi:hypothetical protein
VSWERTVFGTRREPRFGSWWSIALLAALGLIFLLFGSVILGALFWVLAAVAFMIWRMRR